MGLSLPPSCKRGTGVMRALCRGAPHAAELTRAHRGINVQARSAALFFFFICFLVLGAVCARSEGEATKSTHRKSLQARRSVRARRVNASVFPGGTLSLWCFSPLRTPSSSLWCDTRAPAVLRVHCTPYHGTASVRAGGCVRFALGVDGGGGWLPGADGLACRPRWEAEAAST